MQRRDFDDPELTLSELLLEWPDAALVFIARRMLCAGCLIAPFHTIADACAEYDLDEAEFRQELKRWIAGETRILVDSSEGRA